jgi:N utilization substance protein B
VCERLDEIDPLIVGALSADWPMERVELVIRMVLRAGVYELLARPDAPPAVIINEYVDVTHAFYGGNEPGFVNGVLDRIARAVRSHGGG